MKAESKFQRGYKLWNNKEQTEPSLANDYFDCRDGIIKSVEYRDTSGYGIHTQLLLCKDTKHESVAVIRRCLVDAEKWVEEVMYFDTDSFEFLVKLIKEEEDKYCKIELLRNY